MENADSTLTAFVKATEEPAGETYHLRLFVTGATQRSAHAITNIRRILDANLPGRYELEVIDLYQHPEDAAIMLVIAAPTLVKTLPLPLKRLIGDMSNEDRVLLGLGLPVQAPEVGK
jgi:circadian clock protein KaiB